MTESLSTLIDLFSTRQFMWGVALGAIGLVLVAAAHLVNRRAPWALVVAAAVVVGLPLIDEHSRRIVAAAVVLAVGGWLLDRAAVSDGWTVRAAGRTTVVVGGGLIGFAAPGGSARWIVVAAMVVAIIFGALLAEWNDMAESEWLGSMFAMAAFGTWTTVPDTELARLLFGVALVMGIATVRPLRARVTHAGAFALAGVYAWLPTIGGAPRPASIIGAWTCVGLIAVLPVVRHRWPHRSHVPVWQSLGLQAVIALVGARVIGLWTWALPALAASALLFLLATGALWWLASSDRPAVRR